MKSIDLKPISATIAILSILFFSLFASCKKSSPKNENHGIAISANATALAIELNSTSNDISLVRGSFVYNNTSYTFACNKVAAGSETGTIGINDADIFTTTGSVTKVNNNILQVNNVTLPTFFTLKLNSYPVVYGMSGGTVDVDDFNDIKVNVTSATTFFYNSPDDNGFADRYASDLSSFKVLSQKLLNSLNDNDPSTAGDQPMKVSPYVYKQR